MAVVGGAYIGTNIVRAGDHNIATSLQQVNPIQLSSESNYYGKPGQDMLDEVTESFEAGKLSLQRGEGSGAAGTPNSIYEQAHQAAAEEAGIQYNGFQDANGNDVEGPVHGGKTIYYNRMKGKADNIIYIQYHQ
ncbi:hypothetical protein [Chitinophaga sp. LS1]|uniref:hypothetical protein n=1 Tax=Chitinophaga sp. LS1 TaxID=3051176 RepID=UPI002AABF763|nr:hypothetical protein [Chitinophaga sp. LS1]WPV68146.1 hypothetical protein QQL36_05345 [Chitinophaga sp. LS1]